MNNAQGHIPRPALEHLLNIAPVAFNLTIPASTHLLHSQATLSIILSTLRPHVPTNQLLQLRHLLAMQGQDEGQELTPVATYLAERARDAAKGVGVYALYDDSQQLQYVGFARNVAGAIQVHFSSCGTAFSRTWRAAALADPTM